MQARRLIAFVLGLQLAVTTLGTPLAAVPDAPVGADSTQHVELVGSGWADAVACSVCIAGGAFALATIGGASIATILIIGGAEAMGLGAAALACVASCAAAM
jgi:hypothetical protein